MLKTLGRMVRTLAPGLFAKGHHGATAATDAQPALLQVCLGYRETSKDSNWSSFKAVMDTEQLILDREYGGFKAPENEHVRLCLTTELTERIWQHFRAAGLERNLREMRRTEGLGMSGELLVETAGPPPTRMHITGRTRIWGQPQGDRLTNIRHIELFDAAEMFLDSLWMMGKE